MHKLILIFYIPRFAQTRAAQCLTNIEGKVCGRWQWRFGGWIQYTDGMQGGGHCCRGEEWICESDGVSCNNDGNVDRIDLYYNSLKVTIPTEYGLLTSLWYLGVYRICADKYCDDVQPPFPTLPSSRHYHHRDTTTQCQHKLPSTSPHNTK